MFEINYGKIEVVHAADGFQGTPAAHVRWLIPPISDSASAYRFFQFIVVGEQKHNWCLHVRIFALRADLRFATIANCRAFLGGGLS